MIEWINLQQEEQLHQIAQSSSPIIIFKHSTRCSISAFVKRNFEAEWNGQDGPVYYLDLLQYRDLSRLIAEKFNIRHESPQVLVIRDGNCIYDASHSDISAEELQKLIVTN